MLRCLRGGSGIGVLLLTALAVVLAAASGAAAQTTPAPVDPTAALFDGEKLHEIRLEINRKDWDLLKQNYQDNTYYPCYFIWNGQTIRDVGIRSRGLGSRSATKPGLRVDFNRYRTQEFLGLKSLVLDNVVQDHSMLRERLSMNVFARLGLPAPRETHTKLYINDVYLGTYVIVEEIGKDFLRRVYGGTEGNIENDGYLYEYKWKYDYLFTYLGEELGPYKFILEAKTHESKSDSELYDRVHELIREMNETNEGSYVSVASTYFDLPKMFLHLALENFLADYDGILGDFGMNNFYMYQFEDQTKWQFIVWDKDNTIVSGNADEPRRAIEYPILRHFETNQLVRRGINVPEVREMYFNALLRIADSVMEQLPVEEFPDDRRGWLERELVKHYGQIRDAALLDPAKQGDFEQSVEYMLEFTRQRAGWVRQAVANARAATVESARRR